VGATLLGHPTGLFGLFFVEMWERFSYYGMRALLVFYMTKDFLQYSDSTANAVYGAYTSLVYMSPFFGGLLADRLLGARRAIILGGLLMAAGQFMLTVPDRWAFFAGLALLVCGNGFFKPNISTIVGSLYKPDSPKRDGGFTIFYLGINLGAGISPLLCSYIGKEFGRQYGFGVATAGMLAGVALFIAPTRLSRVLILLTSLVTAAGLVGFYPEDPVSIAMTLFSAVALVVAAGIAWVALGRGGLPPGAGAPPDAERLRRRAFGPLAREWLLYLGTVVAVVFFTFLVSGVGLLFRPTPPVPPAAAAVEESAAGEGQQAAAKSPASAKENAAAESAENEENQDLAGVPFGGKPLTLVPQDKVEQMQESPSPLVRAAGVVAEEGSRPASLMLIVAFVACVLYVGVEMLRLDKVARQRMYVVLILTFFSMLFFAFYEQAGSSLNFFTDRNVRRVVLVERTVTAGEVGTTIKIRPTQEQVGYRNGAKMFTLDQLEEFEKLRQEHAAHRTLKERLLRLAATVGLLRQEDKDDSAFKAEIDWKVSADDVGMGIATPDREVPAESLQSVNSIYILLVGPLLAGLWTFLGARGWEPSTTVKFALGLLQLGLGFGIFWYGTRTCDGRGMVPLVVLMVAYLPYTTGELCLSPVGLSMVTRLSPVRLVSTVMGTWFLASAYAQFLAAMIAQASSVLRQGGHMPPPLETVHVYGKVWGALAVSSFVFAAVCFALAPLLNRWMHPEVD
jgi:POT family proton-dependent oligopeptide transporter